MPKITSSPVGVEHLTVYQEPAYGNEQFCVDVDGPDGEGREGGSLGVRFDSPEKAGAYVTQWLIDNLMNQTTYTLCKHCDHFVDPHDDDPATAPFIHLEDGEQEFNHEAEPDVVHTLAIWQVLRPDLFHKHPDGKIGPNSVHHDQKGKA